ncbi:UNVERIFIED_CONTAM: hypothetical protein RMT77_006483 [Armadillidium vulgare]
MKNQTASLLNKILSSVFGVIIIGTAIIASYSSSLIAASLIISSVLSSPIYAIFLLGFLYPKVNLKGVWSGFFITSIFIGWMSMGRFFHGKSPETLPLSAENCSTIEYIPERLNSSIELEYEQDYLFERLNSSIELEYEQGYLFERYLTYIYDVSYTLYPVIGTCGCILISCVVSFMTGNANSKDVNPKYITPFMRKFFWSEEELKMWETFSAIGESDEKIISQLKLGFNDKQNGNFLPLSYNS